MKRIDDVHICVNSSDGTHSVERTIPLAIKGFKISFIAHDEFDRIEELRKFNNVKVYLLNYIQPEKKYNRLSIYTGLIESLKPDLVIVHFCGYDRFHAAIFSGIKPLAGILMGGDVDTHNCKTFLSTYLEFKFTKLFLPYFELLASKTNRIIKMLDSWRLRGKIVHIPWGVKISEEIKVKSLSAMVNTKNVELTSKNKEQKKKELRQELGLPLDKFLVLSNRNVASSGRQMEILKGFHDLIKQGLDIYLLVVVRTDVYEYLCKVKDYVEKNDLKDYVMFYDYIPQNEMMMYYSACDVLVSNWVHDGLPQTFFEASHRGLPIIMNDLPQFRDYYADNISALINDGSAEGFSNSIKTLYNDINLRDSISENSVKVVKEKANFDMWAEYFINEIIELLDSKKKIRIPYIKIIYGKLLMFIIIVTRRFPFSKIRINI